ncbi:MFS transporter [Streptomyces achromogenes]|uniref:MFS transporter n=1 Tax=Streptomyces achromogenes TaxID=67255 RepID=UPI003A811B1D
MTHLGTQDGTSGGGAATPAAGTTRSPDRTAPPWVIVTLACLGQFMVLLDVSIVNVALPSIQTGLGFSDTGLQWVVNAYTLAFAGFLMLGGRAGDLLGRKRVYIAGIAVFTAASLVGGLADSPGVLIVARVVQGVGAAFLSPITLALLTTTFPEGPKRASALGLWSAVAGGAGAVGSIAGGLLTGYLSWRWILLVNIPIGIALIAGCVRYLDHRRSEGPRRLDILGAATVTLALLALVYGIVNTAAYGWTSPQVLPPLIIGLVLLALFCFVEERVAKVPLIRLGLLRARSVAGGNLVGLLMNAAFLSMWYFVSLYLQNVRGFSPIQAGLAFLPHTLMVMTGARLSSRLISRAGTRPLILAGALSALAGFVWQSQLGPHSDFVLMVVLPGMLMALGVGLVFTPVAAAATSGVAPADAGVVSGLLNTSRQIGGALGLAILTTIATSRIQSLSGDAQPSSDNLVSGYGLAFLVAAAFVVLGAASALVLPRVAKNRS